MANQTNVNKSGKGGYNRNRKPNGPKGKESMNEAFECDYRKPGAIDANRPHKSGNPIGYWNKAKALYDAATKIPFNKVLGEPEVAKQFRFDTGSIKAIPGLARVGFIPGPGYANGNVDAVNKAATIIYDRIVSKTSGALQMQQMDIMMFELGTDSILTWIGFAKRAIEAANLYYVTNNYYPAAILQSMGLDKDEIIRNKNAYWFRLNDLIKQFNNLGVLKVNDLHNRHFDLASKVFQDDDSMFAQTTVMVPAGYYKYVDTPSGSDTNISDVAFLKWISTEYHTYDPNSSDSPYEFSTVLDIIDEMLTDWYNTSNLSIIKGNINRAFEQSERYYVAEIDPNQVLIPSWDTTWVWQLSNMFIVPVYTSTASGDVRNPNITQSPVGNFLVWTPQISASSHVTTGISNLEYVYLRSYNGDTSPEFAMESTRLTSFAGNLDSTQHIRTASTEICVSYDIFDLVRDSNNKLIALRTEFHTNSSVMSFGTGYDPETLVRGLLALQKFRTAPAFYIIKIGAEGEPTGAFVPTGDIWMYTTITSQQLENLNIAALYSIWNV